MPRQKKEGWERVTITISGEASHALRILAAVSRHEMGEVADDFLKRGGLLDGVSLLMPHPAKPQAPAPAAPSTVPDEPHLTGRKVAKVKRTAKGKARGRKAAVASEPPPVPVNPKDERFRRLFAFVETLIHDGRFTQGELMAEIGATAAAYRSGWRATGTIPAKHTETVVRFLLSKGVQIPDLTAVVKPPKAE
jgi:hypothetical protein